MVERPLNVFLADSITINQSHQQPCSRIGGHSVEQLFLRIEGPMKQVVISNNDDHLGLLLFMQM
jgi:hypothetical protein